jgi:thiol-disulfide isomerase/thioredoxin
VTRRDLILFTPSVLPALDTNDAPDFHAKTLAQAKFTKASLKGKVVLVQFWATWCGFCRRDQEPLDEVYMDLLAKGLEVLAVSVREPERKVRAYLNENPRTVPVVLTADTNLLQQYPTTGFPAYFVITREGKLAAAAKGAQGREGLLRLVAKAGLA